MAKKYFVLDTSVLLHSPQALQSFGDNEVIIPAIVLDEIDKFKRGTMELNRNARLIIKELDQLRLTGDMEKGVKLAASGTTVRVDLNRAMLDLLPPGFEINNDNRILAVALAYKQAHPRRSVTVVSKDINMRVKAQALGLTTEDYLTDKVAIDEMYTGHRTLVVPTEAFEALYATRELPLARIDDSLMGQPLHANGFVTVVNAASPSSTALARYDHERGGLMLLREGRNEVWGVRPLNREQKFALELLLDDRIKLVTLSGKAGTGKTMLAIAAGLQKVLNEKAYRRLSVYRPVVPMGKDIGYLPGSEQEKLSPWMQPIFDNLEFLLDAYGPGSGGYGQGAGVPSSGGGPGSRKGAPQGSNPGHRDSSKLDYLIDSNVLEIGALTYIRGRSLPGLYIIIDESQNLTPHEVKTIITRAGEGTKIVFTGDPYQIDHPYLDTTSNGLTYTVEKFKGYPLVGHITLTKGERSELAELASTVLSD